MMETFIASIPGDRDSSSRINQALDGLANGSTLRLAPGVYPLSSPIDIHDKANIVVEAAGATLVCHYDSEKPLVNSSEAFHVTNAEDITIRGATITTGAPIAVLATVVAVTETAVDLEIDESYQPTHREFINNAIAFTGKYEKISYLWPEVRDGEAFVRIAGEIVTTNPFTGIGFIHEWIGERTLRLHDVKNLKKLGNLSVGCRCSVDFSYYGLTAMVFRNATRVTIEDVSVQRFGGMGFVILPRCSDFVFRRVAVAQPSTDEAFDSIASDGIHTTGLGGYLKLLDCTLNYTRDDPLNLHTQFLTVMSVDGARLHLVYDKTHGAVSQDWAKPGDILRFYNPQSCAPMGTAIVAEIQPATGANGRREAYVRLENCEYAVQPGDLVANMFYFADLLIDGCKVESYRRGFVIQSAASAVIRNCVFTGGGMNVYISANYGKYLEAGHVSHAVVEGNEFRNCTKGNVVLIRAGGPGTLGPGNSHNVPTKIHQDIVVRNNVFMDNSGVQINANSTEGLRIEGNTFNNCGDNPVVIEQCSDVVFKDNRTNL